MAHMELPHAPSLQYAFSYPRRLSSAFPRVDFALLESTFEQRMDRFRNLIVQALEKGVMPCVLNAANEVCVAFLREGWILQMSDIIADTMAHVPFGRDLS